MGELKSKVKEIVVAVKKTLDECAPVSESMGVATPGGRIYVRWDIRANETAMG
jgi:hypothetical protein